MDRVVGLRQMGCGEGGGAKVSMWWEEGGGKGCVGEGSGS